jgi:hypothetical protein
MLNLVLCISRTLALILTKHTDTHKHTDTPKHVTTVSEIDFVCVVYTNCSIYDMISNFFDFQQQQFEYVGFSIKGLGYARHHHHHHHHQVIQECSHPRLYRLISVMTARTRTKWICQASQPIRSLARMV